MPTDMDRCVLVSAARVGVPAAGVLHRYAGRDALRVLLRCGPVGVDLSDNADRDVPIHCCICINVGRGEAARTPATTVVMGYAVCNEHTELMSHQDFQFSRYVEAARKQRKNL